MKKRYENETLPERQDVTPPESVKPGPEAR